LKAWMQRGIFEQVFVTKYGDAMAGNFNVPAIVGMAAIESKTFEDAVDDRVLNRRSEKFFDTFPAKSSDNRSSTPRVDVNNVAVNASAGQFLYQSARPIAREAGHFDVGAAFESIRSLGGEAKRARRFPNGKWIEMRTFQKHVS